jgi:hypothetical protein
LLSAQRDWLHGTHLSDSRWENRRGDNIHKYDDILFTTMATERCTLRHAFP